MEFINNINLNQNELRNAKIHILGADPGSPVEGQFWYNSVSKKIKYFDGTAVQTLVDLNGLAGLLEYKGTINASANPNYPAGEIGDVYVFSVGGKIGGASGEVVEAGDMIICNTNNAGGTEASVGTSWDTINKNIPSGLATKFTQTGVSVGTTPGVQTITHNLNSRSVVVQVFNEATNEQLFLDVIHTTVNAVTVSANGATKTVTVTVIG